VNRDRLLWIFLLFLLLTSSLLFGRQLFSHSPAEATSFRQRFWEERSLDLAVQVGLIYVGALGLAALLPREEEDE
jgi:hypothetical protein